MATKGFGRDGVTGVVTPARAMRAREVSRPSAEEREAAERAADAAVARLVTRARGQASG